MSEATFTTYHSTNAKPSEAWVAYINNFKVFCLAATEQEAKDKAETFWNRERIKWSDSVLDTIDPTHAESFERPMKPLGKQHHLAGKVWLLNRTTGHKCRVSSNEIDRMMEQGYVRAGPRSK